MEFETSSPSALDTKAIDHSTHPDQQSSITVAVAEPPGTMALVGTQLAAAPAELGVIIYTYLVARKPLAEWHLAAGSAADTLTQAVDRLVDCTHHSRVVDRILRSLTLLALAVFQNIAFVFELVRP